MSRRSTRARKPSRSFIEEANAAADSAPPRSATSRARRPRPRSAGGILHPVDTDVLLGRGRRVEAHAGNQKFRRIVEQTYLSGYLPLTTRNEKFAYTNAIVQQLKADGMRFLRATSDRPIRWEEVNNEAARVKVGQQLRYRQRQLSQTVAAEAGRHGEEKLDFASSNEHNIPGGLIGMLEFTGQSAADSAAGEDALSFETSEDEAETREC